MGGDIQATGKDSTIKTAPLKRRVTAGPDRQGEKVLVREGRITQRPGPQQGPHAPSSNDPSRMVLYIV